jgi:hypothetical protein
MAYIGKTPTVGNFQVCDAISVVNNQAAYTMQVGSVNVSPESSQHMIVSLNGVIQKPTDAFTVSGSTITFASNLVTGDVINFIQILGSVLDLGVPSDDTVTASKLSSNAVTTAKILNANVTTAKIADANVTLAKLSATGTKNSTTFLRGDNTFATAGLTGVSTDSGNVTITDGNLTFGGAGQGIHLGVTSATAANLLDDYEEGTWTLAVTGQGGDTGQVSRYTKIGNRVFIDAFYECDTNVSATDSSQPMQGLPFSAGTSSRAIINLKLIKTSAVAGYGGAPTLGSSSAISLETYNSNFIIRPISTTETNTSLYYRQDIFQQGTLIRLSGVYETTA